MKPDFFFCLRDDLHLYKIRVIFSVRVFIVFLQKSLTLFVTQYLYEAVENYPDV
jgi:hypothetical protein